MTCNVLNRTILPVLRKAGIEWHGWHAFRRGLATNLYRLGVADKTIQAILRHANVGTTMNIYVIGLAPKIKLLRETVREQTIDPDTEAKLLAVAKQPMKDVLVIIQDTGMRPEEVFRIRIENIEWTRKVIFNPHGKTRASRRNVPISERMFDRLMFRCAGKKDGWLFPSPRAADGHLTTVAKQFREARRKAGLPESLVLYCARHTFATTAYEATGNLAMIMKVMGHTDVRTSMRYQHPAVDSIRDAIDQRNLRHNSRHSELRVQ